jgi:hypothetical protein
MKSSVENDYYAQKMEFRAREFDGKLNFNCKTECEREREQSKTFSCRRERANV